MGRPAIHMTKEQTARWLGYGSDIAALDRDHDPLHRRLCSWLGIPSYSMKDAAGEPLTADERRLAEVEEDAVLCVQRLVQHHKVSAQVEGGSNG